MDNVVKKKIFRVSTVALSLDVFCRGFLSELNAKYEVEAIASPSTRLLDLGKREGISTYGLEMKRAISPFADFLAILKLSFHFLNLRPECVHTITPKAGLIGMMAAWLTRVPVRIHTFTGLLFPTEKSWKKWLFKLSDKMICRCATNIIAEGKGIKTDLVEGKITRKRIDILGNGNLRGIDPEHYRKTEAVEREGESVNRRLGFEKNDVIILFIGRIVKEKGIEELLAAMEYVVSKHKNYRLLMVGSEVDENKTSSLELKVWKAADRCKWLRLVPWVEDVRPYYAIANCVVLPSYREGFPNVILEAGAMSCPCIVTNVNGSREIIKDGKNGRIVPIEDAQSLGDAIIEIGNDRNKQKKMGCYGRENVIRKYESAYVRKCQIEFYDKLLNSD